MNDNGQKQILLDARYLRMAKVWAENSYCKRRKVGALLVKDKMIISDGFNGTPVGFENICEDEEGRTKPYVLHAEANAITKVAESNNSSKGEIQVETAVMDPMQVMQEMRAIHRRFLRKIPVARSLIRMLT